MTYWRVEVHDDNGHLVSLASDEHFGRDIGEAEARTIRRAARHLLAFVGEPDQDSRLLRDETDHPGFR